MRLRLAFPTLLAGTFVLGTVAFAQAVPTGWDVIVTVRRDRVGGDLVTVGPRAPNYPADLLRSQIVALGERLGREARGVSVAIDPSTHVLRGSCGVDGLIDRATGSLAIAPVAQAFAGAPAPFTVHRMVVSFDGEVPGPRTVAMHTAGRESDLAFTGRLVGSSIEYDVELRSQNPNRLVIHEKAPAVASKPAPSRIDAATAALFAIGALAAGALVYCVLLLVGRRPLAKS